MGREQLQGTPWHEEQMHRTCKDGSTYCLFNHKNKCSFITSKYYNSECRGKGTCSDFESKGSTAKTCSEKTIIVKTEPKNSKFLDRTAPPSLHIAKPKMLNKEDKHMDENVNVLNDDESKEEKFKRISKDRVNKVVKSIETLENLANTNQYDYTEEQVNKMFNFIENALTKAKESFQNKKTGQKFDW